MYSRVGSIIVNLMLGIGMCFSVVALLIYIEGVLMFSTKDYVVVGIITLVWVSLCLCYNYARYQKLLNGQLFYNRACYFITLFFPLFFWTILTLLLISVVK